MSAFGLQDVSVTCPHCRRAVELTVDCSMAEQRYVDDCPACQHPIGVHAIVGDDDIPLVRVTDAGNG